MLEVRIVKLRKGCPIFRMSDPSVPRSQSDAWSAAHETAHSLKAGRYIILVQGETTWGTKGTWVYRAKVTKHEVKLK